MTDRARTRRQLRAQRRALDPQYRQEAALAISHHLVTGLLGRRFRRIAGYVAAGAEADPGPFIAAARLRGRRLFLPVLKPTESAGLRFVLTAAGQPLVPNRYGIAEPAEGTAVRPQFLDLVLVPLVGFDDRGHRLGMGAGYYDRTFAFLRGRTHWRKPRLVGVAYACQRVPVLAPAPWDVPLDAVVTETGLHWF